MKYHITATIAPEKLYVEDWERCYTMKSMDDYYDWEAEHYDPYTRRIEIDIEADSRYQAGKKYVQMLLDKGGEYRKTYDPSNFPDHNYLKIGNMAWHNFTIHDKDEQGRDCGYGYHMYMFIERDSDLYDR